MVNIFRKQQNILYVSPTYSSGSRERMLIRDCLLLKEIGHNIFLYCLKDSFLHRECKKAGIDCIFHSGTTKLRVWNWYKLNKLRGIIKRYDINIVHCYQLNFLWPLASYLRKRNLTALFFTINFEMKKFYKQFWYRPLIRRIDLIFIPFREMIESINAHMDVPIRKIYSSGLGVNKINFDQRYTFDEENLTHLSCWVNDHEVELDDLTVCLESLWSLNLDTTMPKRFKLHIFSNRKWKMNILYKPLKEKIAEYKLENYVEFHESNDIYDVKSDIWISYTSKSPIEDYALLAILKGIPTAVPRNATTQELHRIYHGSLETYRQGDARELRAKVKEIVLRNKEYKQACFSARDELWNEHGIDGYKYNLFKLYEKHLNKRIRFYN